MKLRTLVSAILAVLLAASAVVIAPPQAEAITSRDQKRVHKVAEVVAALEGWAAVDGDYVVDGTGYNGNGSGWYQLENSTYTKSIASGLIDAGFLRGGGDLPVDPSDTRLDHHSIYDFIIVACADRVGVWARTSYERPATSDDQWWSDNDCGRPSAHKYMKLSAPAAQLVTHDSQRIAAVDEVVAALESWAAVEGDYVVDGAGYNGLGLGWFDLENYNYPASIARTLADAGHLSAGIPSDPGDPVANSQWAPFEFRVYPCAGRAGVFARTHGTIYPTDEDKAWWQANAENVDDDVNWWIENKCPQNVLEPADRVYFKLTQGLGSDDPDPDPDDGAAGSGYSYYLNGEMTVCATLLSGVPVMERGMVSGSETARAGRPDADAPAAYVWVPDGYRLQGAGSIQVSHDNFGAGLQPFTLSHYFERDGVNIWSFDTVPLASIAEWRVLNHPDGKFYPVAGSIVDVVTGTMTWDVSFDTVPASSNPPPRAEVPCIFRLADERPFWGNKFGPAPDLGAPLFDWAVENRFNLWQAIGTLNTIHDLANFVLQFAPFASCAGIITDGVSDAKVIGCAIDFLPAGLRIFKTILPSGATQRVLTRATPEGFIDDGYRVAGRSVCRSFSADTKVLMADGGHRPMAEIAVGDLVLASDPRTGESGPRRVEALWPHFDTLFKLELDTGEIMTTEDHLFWNATDAAWQEVQHFDIGDQALTSNGTSATVAGLDWSTRQWGQAYDISVQDLRTYYVLAGAEAVLVHNCDLDALSAAGRVADRNGFTAAGRAAQKHAQRPGSTFPQPPDQRASTYNEFGQDLLDDLLTASNTATQRWNHPSFGQVTDFWGPSYGARFGPNDEFIGFL